MSNIDKRAQKELYAKVERQAHSLRGCPLEYQALTGLCPVNVIEMHAQKIQALLDELEAKDSTIATQQQEIRTLLNALGQASEKRNAEQADIIAKQEKWIKDVEGTMISATDRAEAAEKRIAELSALQGKPIAWESTTPVYVKFITDERYQRLRPGYKKWYKPYRCSQCSAAGKGE